MSTMSSRRGLAVALAGISVIAALFLGWRFWPRKPEVEPKPKLEMTKVIELNTLGVAWMERFEYTKAEPCFFEITEGAPDWIPGHINLAISLFNQDKPEKIDRAIGILRMVLGKEPDNIHANYCLGFLLLHNKDFNEAIPFFERVTRLDAEDAGSWANLAEIAKQQGNQKKATELYEKALALNPYHTQALNHLLVAVDDERRREELLLTSERLRAGRVNAQQSQKYTEQGSRYARVIGRVESVEPARDQVPLPASEPFPKFQVKLAAGVVWAKAADFGNGPVAELRRAIRQRFGATVVALDFNNDGRMDLFLTAAVVESGAVRDLLLQNDGDSKFSDVTKTAGLGDPRPSLGCAVGDFDNDGFVDLFVSGVGQQSLFHNTGKGAFENVTAKAGLDKLSEVCLGAAWVDLDQDSDIDLVVARYAETPEKALVQLKGQQSGGGGLAVFVNAGKAPPSAPWDHFGPLSVAFSRRPPLEDAVRLNNSLVTFAITDADADADVDVVALPDQSAPALMVNDRLLRFQRSTLDAAGKPEAWCGVVVLDVDQDERSELLLFSAGTKPALLRNRGRTGLEKTKLYEQGAVDSPPLRSASVSDYDLDGWPDVVGLSDKNRPVLLHNDRSGRLIQRADALGPDRDWPDDLLACSVMDLDGDGVVDVWAWSEAKGLVARRGLSNGNQSVLLHLVGNRENASDPGERVNNDAIGSRVVVQSGRQWTAREITNQSGGLGFNVGPMRFGLGRASVNDAIVRVQWPDMTVQAEFLSEKQLPESFIDRKDRVWQLREKNRKPISCPILITWDGEQWVYITDFIGAGSMGEMLAEGGTRPPRPEEALKIEAHQLRPRNGEFLMRIAEPMDEVTYLDRLRLDVIDLPPGVDVLPDERFATSDPAPTQERLFFRDRFLAVKAIDHQGNNVTNVVRDRDKKMIGPSHYCAWIGFAGEHFVELDFGDQLAKIGPKDRVFLVLAGWTDYPYPESIFAAKQAGVEVEPPMLEKMSADGEWQTICDLGFPAGLNRVMTRDVTGLLAGFQSKLRIRTNMQVYWDQIFVAPIIDGRESRVTELPVASASLAYRGFLREVHPDKSPLIEYDANRIESVQVTRWKGGLTRFGDVTELLSLTDDRYAILGPGDEMTVKIDAKQLPPLKIGWTRQYILRTWGWCKDSSIFTASGGEVGPMPFRAMKQYPPGADERYPHPDDLKKWHTRSP